MKVKVSEATNQQLNRMVAKIEGRALRDPVYATNKDVESSMTPFTLWETTGTYRDDTCIGAAVSPIKVTRYGINHAVGASAPSISFTDSNGRSALGSVGMFFLTKEEAELDAQLCEFGGLDGYSPTTDWAQGGLIIEENSISTIRCEDDYKTDRRGFTTSKRIPVWGAVAGEQHSLVKSRDSYGSPCGDVYEANADVVSYGHTPLIAAMRCFVISRLGDEVEVPEELK